MHRLRLLDLGHHGSAAAGDLLGLGDVVGALHERQPDPVDAGVERGIEVGAVLRRERRERQDGIGQADALAVAQFAADLDAHDDLLLGRLGRDQANLAVVEQQRVAGPDALEDFRMRQVHALRVAGRGVRIERERRAVVEHGRAAGERSDPQLRSLQVDQDADGPAVVVLDLPDRRDQLAHAVVRGVAHVDAEHVGAGLEQLGDHRRIARRGAERGDDLGAAQASHLANSLRGSAWAGRRFSLSPLAGRGSG
jgi:hypothetical protein